MKELLWLRWTSPHAAESDYHNRRKLPLISHKAAAVLQEVQASRGNIPLCFTVKVLDLKTAAVNTCCESKRSSGRCPPLLLYQETLSRNKSCFQEAATTTSSSEVMFWIVSWGKPVWGEVGSLPGLCQSGLTWLQGIVLQQQEPPRGSQASKLRFSPDHRVSSAL